MAYHPCFRTILVEPIVQKKKKSTVLLPEGEEQLQPRYTHCKVVEFSKDCQLYRSIANVSEERFVIVETHMIQQINVMERDLFVVPETAVILMSAKD